MIKKTEYHVYVWNIIMEQWMLKKQAITFDKAKQWIDDYIQTYTENASVEIRKNNIVVFKRYKNMQKSWERFKKNTKKL
jgi:hypothetical protein